jgi:phytoene dehydrogenase-like protein
MERLRRAGFSPLAIESLWRPLFGGIQLDPELEVSSRRFEVILRMLVSGQIGLPALGIGEIAAQLGATLPPDKVRLEARVSSVESGVVRLDSGEVVRAGAVVVATEAPEAHRLLGTTVPDPGSLAAACCWFAATEAPLSGPVLVLDGDASGPMKNLAVVSEVCPSYAPSGRALVAAAVPGRPALDPKLEVQVREQLARWFGSATRDWDHLRTDVVRHGHPAQFPPLHPKRRATTGTPPRSRERCSVVRAQLPPSSASCPRHRASSDRQERSRPLLAGARRLRRWTPW